MQHKRPFGVTAIAVIHLVNAGSAVLQTEFVGGVLDGNLDRISPFVIARLVYSSVGLVLAVGLWRLAKWAWVATMLWTGVTLTTALLAYYRGEPQFVPMALSVPIVFYLNSREVQAAFDTHLARKPDLDEEPAYGE